MQFGAPLIFAVEVEQYARFAAVLAQGGFDKGEHLGIGNAAHRLCHLIGDFGGAIVHLRADEEHHRAFVKKIFLSGIFRHLNKLKRPVGDINRFLVAVFKFGADILNRLRHLLVRFFKRISRRNCA